MHFTLTNTALSLQRVNDNDTPTLLAIYSSTREEELQLLQGWNLAQKESFVLQQFNAQHNYYKHQYQQADFYIINVSEKVAGRLYIDCSLANSSVRIIDITLLPAYKNSGIGTGILTDIINYGNVVKKPISLHVSTSNPAIKLYQRLGFKVINEANSMYFLLEHTVKKQGCFKTKEPDYLQTTQT